MTFNYLAENELPNDPQNIKKNREYKKHLKNVIFPTHFTEMEDKLVHPRDYNNPDYVAFQHNYEYVCPEPLFLKYLNGSYYRNRLENKKITEDLDEVVIDVENLKIKEIIFWEYYNFGKRRPDIFEPIHSFFWYNLALIVIFFTFWARDEYLIKKTRNRKIKRDDKMQNLIRKQNMKSNNIQKETTKERFSIVNPFSAQDERELRLMVKDLKRELKMDPFVSLDTKINEENSN